MIILGLNYFHADSSACLLIDGKLVGAIAEERLGERIKNNPNFPYLAINFLCNLYSVRLKDIDHVAIPRNENSNLLAKVLYTLKNNINNFNVVKTHFNRRKSREDLTQKIAFALKDQSSNARFKIHKVEHHLSHIASSYFTSSFDKNTWGISFDGSGDFVSCMIAKCNDNKINVLKRVYLPHSLGMFYTAMCQFIGFDRFGEEYKVMGLASYGKDIYKKEMNSIISLDDKMLFKINPKYVAMHKGDQSGVLTKHNKIAMGDLAKPDLANLFGDRIARGDISERAKNIAKSTQAVFERITGEIVKSLPKTEMEKNMVLAGGCALNGVNNYKLIKETNFKCQFIHPAASDDGTSVGAAFHVWHNTLGMKERFQLFAPYLGGEYSDYIIEKCLDELLSSQTQRFYCNNRTNLLSETVNLLRSGKVVGWFQGRSEWGPRALGNRSIIADPTNPNIKMIINEKIKRRESFRPFAPSVKKELVSKYFEDYIESPFMMHVVPLKSKWHDLLPAITHVDGTGRLQTVSRENNSLYYDLISAFEKKTGHGLLLNTSFNENEPIVETPHEAISCFKRTNMDALIIGNWITIKNA